MRIVLYQPDIPQNTGAILRLAACLGVPVDVIEPAGFALGDRALRRSGMDYLSDVTLVRHATWRAWQSARVPARSVLFSTKAQTSYLGFGFKPDDCLMFGRESAGVPDDIHNAVDARVVIPMLADRRSLNVTHAVAMGLGEALRQTGGFPIGAQSIEMATT